MNGNDKKEVIDLIDNLNAISFYELNEHSKECYYEIRNAILAMSIDALQEPCEDTISREAVLDQTYLWSKDEFLRVTNPFYYLRKRINSLPSVTPQQKTGHWIVHPKGIYAHLICDNCLSHAPFDCRTNYCPGCGCRMIEPQESKK